MGVGWIPSGMVCLVVEAPRSLRGFQLSLRRVYSLHPEPSGAGPYFRTFVLSYFRTFVLSYFRTFVPSYLRTFVPSYLRTFVPFPCTSAPTRSSSSPTSP